VLAIGPAGENLVRFANLIHKKGHAAGRTGMGAVWGAKKLKAIYVAGIGEDSQSPGPEALKALRSRTQGDIRREHLHQFPPVGRHSLPAWMSASSAAIFPLKTGR
jgi:aldehyde:ferredoxin oxidoreductase